MPLPGRIILIATCLMAFTGCTRHQKAAAVVEYVNQGILKISSLEKKAWESYASATGSGFRSKSDLYNTLKDETIPIYERFLFLLERVKTKDPEIKRLHSIFVAGARRVLRGLKTKMAGLETDDINLIHLGNRMIQEGYDETEKWRLNLNMMREKYRVGSVLP